MRFATTAVMLIGSAFSVLADTGPMIVIPGRPGVPVLINGIDASYGVIEGDWGLAKSVHVQPTVYYGHAEAPPPPVGHYYPSSGKLPGYGRVEIEPPADRPLPPQAESYFRSWSAQSAPPAQQAQPPQNPPPVILAPQFDGSGPRRGPSGGSGGPGRRGG
jgi:hypothetical protein